MSLYLRDLTQRVLTVFLASLGGMMAAAQPFDVVTFGWVRALTVAASAAVLALVLGAGGEADRDAVLSGHRSVDTEEPSPATFGEGSSSRPRSCQRRGKARAGESLG